MPGGRPTKYRPDILDLESITNLCLLGLTDAELAHHLRTPIQTLLRWKAQHSELREAIADGRERADGRVAAALYKRALGYDVEQTKVNKAGELVTFTQHIPGDFNSISLFLRNREPERWRDRTEVVHDISDRVADRLEAARQRMLGQLEARVIIDATATTDAVGQPVPAGKRTPTS